MTHLAHRVRRLADNIADRRPDQPLSRNQRLAQHLASVAALLWEHGDDAYALAADWAATGLTSGRGTGVSSGAVSRPTETAALAELDRPDALSGYDRWLRFYRGHLEMEAEPMERILTDICTRTRRDIDPHPGTTTIVDAHTGKENRVPECAEYYCKAPALNPRRGRCDACRKWQDRWLERHPGADLADAPVVPKTVIDARTPAKRRTRAVA